MGRLTVDSNTSNSLFASTQAGSTSMGVCSPPPTADFLPPYLHRIGAPAFVVVHRQWAEADAS